MNITSIDTHAMAKQFIAVGFTDQQAEAVTNALRQAQDIDLSSLATKTDLADLRAELKADWLTTKADLAELRSATKADITDVRREIAETKTDIVKWVVGIGLAQAGFVVAMIKLMH